MVAPYTNVNNYSPTDILRQIEYNVYPSFLLTEDANYELEDTGIAEYFSTRYTDWSSEIIEVYKLVNEVLSPVIGQKITDRQVLEQGVVVVSYETGCVLVNYTGESYSYQGHEIPALSAEYWNEE